jgi:hypothetical protein
MENEPLLPKEIIDLPIKKPIQEGISIINENPLGFLEKTGNYEFIYDYQVPNFSWQNLLKQSESIAFSLPSMYKEGGSNANMIAPSIMSQQSVALPVKVNSDPQVGTFSKGNIVNVLRFDGNNAIIQNPNYVEPDTNAPKSFWAGLIGDLKNQKEFSIPKDYLRKADDTLAVTLSTGILYGANMKPQPLYYNDFPYVKPILTTPVNQTILEENASFVLTRDFQYVSGYGSSIYDEKSGLGSADMSPKYSTIKAGTKLTGRLFREINNTLYKLQVGAITPPNYNDYLAVKGYGSQGSINIPIEYLTKEVPTQSGVVVPQENKNRNLFLIVGAFIVGYALFSNDKQSN